MATAMSWRDIQRPAHASNASHASHATHASHAAHATLPPGADEPLIVARPTDTTVSIVVTTRPGPALNASDRRRIGRLIDGIRRRLDRRGVPPPERSATVRRLVGLVHAARRAQVGEGLALVAGPDDATLLHPRHPVRPRTLVGPAPSLIDLAEACATVDPLAIVQLTPDRARLLTTRGGVLREHSGDGFPLDRRRRRPAPPLRDDDLAEHLDDHLDDVDGALALAVPITDPVVVAGDERVARAFADRHGGGGRVVGVLEGDHRATAPLTLLALARRHLRGFVLVDPSQPEERYR